MLGRHLMMIEKLLPVPLISLLLVSISSRAAGQVVINEIQYHPRSELRDDEYLELHNLADAPADVGGWALTDGVSFVFPRGTSIPARGFLVVAANALQLRDKYGLSPETVVGDYVGAIANEGERLELSDSAGHTVDAVSYLDEFPWPVSPDGGGPSLECVDPYRDNSTPRNWLPSENRSSWVPVSLQGNATSKRLYLYLEGAGECLIDDIRLTEAGSEVNLLPDGDFESGAAGWNMTGTHAGSSVTSAEAHSGSSSLHVVATGAGQSASASVYRDIDSLVVGQPYELVFWARSLSGNSSLINRLSGGGLLARTDLRRLDGTPGMENSARSDNLPPLVSAFSTKPALPSPGEPVALLATVQDDDISKVGGFYDPGDGPVEIPLRDDGRSSDGIAGDGIYGGSIPAAARGSIVDFWAYAVDSAGARSETPRRRYPVADPPPESNLPVYSIFIRSKDWDRLNADIWTDEYFPAVFVHDGEIFTDAGLRFRGGRPRLFRKKSLKLSFSDEHPFEGRRKANLNAAAMDDDYLTEPLAYWFYERAGMEASRARFVRVELNGEFWGLFIHIEQVNEDYLRRFGLDPEGALYKAVGVVGSLRKLDGMLYNGQSYTYQSQYEKEIRTEEPYDDLIAFIHGLYDTPAAGMEAYLAANLEVEQYINYLATTNVMCIWDTIQHNYYFYRDTLGTGKWRIFPWDNDHAWGEWEWNYYYDDTYHIYMGTESHPFANVWYTWNKLWTVLLDVPSYRAAYIRRVRELLNTVFAEGPLFRKIDELRAEMEATALLDEAKWPDDLEPLHAGPKRTFAQEIPILKQNISRRRAHLARVVGIQLEDIPPQARYLRGDVDGNTSVDMADALKLLWFLFLGGNALDCADAADADDSGAVEITDAIGVLRYLFAGGPTPPAPGPADCGEDSTADALGCDVSACR